MLLLCADSSPTLGEDEKGANLNELKRFFYLNHLHSYILTFVLLVFENFFPVRVDEIVKSLDISRYQPESEKRLSTLLTMCTRNTASQQ